MRNIVRKKIQSLPNLGHSINMKNVQELIGVEYLSRITRVRERMGEFTHLIIYGDREHFSNIEYFTGYDPRFEEAILIIPKCELPSLIVGNEGDSYSNTIGYQFRKFIYPTFSLPGQHRVNVQPLDSILKLTGVNEHSNIGLIGWKLFSHEDHMNPHKAFDIPYFIMESLLNIVSIERITNAIEIMIGFEMGMRSALEIKELILSELSGTLSSRATYNVLRNLQEGMTEIEASDYLKINGIPLIAHPNINFGENLSFGLASPMFRTQLSSGDIVGVGMAYRRSLCHKVGYFIDSSSEEPEDRKDYYNKYFGALAAWYQALKIGASGEEIYESVKKEVGDLGEFGIGLNPGHLIHTDEWTNSPFRPGCRAKLRSGMMIQCDFTAAKPEKNLIAHAEDGLLLADKETRVKIAQLSPEAWVRIQERRQFMKIELGIVLSDEVLPTSDLPGIIFPFLKDLNTVIAFG